MKVVKKLNSWGSNRGDKFTYKEFHALCESHGICRPPTISRSLYENSVTERKKIELFLI